MPLSGNGRALFQPIWAEDVADCVMAMLARGEDAAARALRARRAGDAQPRGDRAARRCEAAGRRRPVVKVPSPVVRRSLKLGEALLGAGAPATWDEAELLEVSLTTPRGAADARALGVEPRRMAEVLGAGLTPRRER